VTQLIPADYSPPAVSTAVLKSTDDGVTWVDKSNGISTSAVGPSINRHQSIEPASPLCRV